MNMPGAPLERATAAAPLLPPDSNEVRFQRFLLWLEENGASFPGVRLRTENGDRAICASGAVRPGQLAMFIPRHLMITGELAWNSEIGRLMQPLDLPGSAFLAAFLIMNKREGSFFKPYVDILPEDVSHMPIFLTDAELALLKGTFALRKVTEEIEGVKTEYALLAAHLPAEFQFSEQEYAWAKAAVRSRLLTVFFQNDIAMVPLADMMNHAPDKNVDWGGESRLGFACTAAQPIAEGAPLTISYGRFRGNGTMFAYYGFTLANNPNDDTEILLPEPAPDHPASALMARLGQVIEGKRRFTPIASYGDERTQALLNYLRAYQAQTDAVITAPVSRENELAALAMLTRTCCERLAEFELAADASLDAGALSSRLRDVLHVRDGEIRVLHYLLDLAEAGTALLNGEEARPGFDDYFAALESLLPVAVS